MKKILILLCSLFCVFSCTDDYVVGPIENFRGLGDEALSRRRVTPVNEIRSNEWYCIGTYAFEDKADWDNGYDFDVNDVVIEHWTNITYDKSNVVSRVRDAFFVKHVDGSTTDPDGFYVAYPANQKNKDVHLYCTDANFTVGEELLSGQDVFISSTNSAKIFDDIHKVTEGQGWLLDREIAGKAVYLNDVINLQVNELSWDPYIINYNFSKKLQIHVLELATKNGTKERDIRFDDQAWVMEHTGYYPLAVYLPNVSNWTPSIPGKAIYKTYPDYINWFKTGDDKYKEWYK